MASNMLTIKQAIIDQWHTNFAPTAPTPTEYHNVTFKGNRENPYVQFLILFGKSESIICGDGTQTRHNGMIKVNILVPLLTGSNLAYELADDAAAALERKRFGTVTTRNASLTEGPISTENYSLILTVPFVDS